MRRAIQRLVSVSKSAGYVTWATDATSEQMMEWEHDCCSKNYHPLDVVICKGEGVYVWDVDGNKYYDFLSAYSAVSQGHNHPRIVNALIEQATELSLISRAFYNDKLGQFAKYITDLFGYDEICPMNAGAEAVETALKATRKWGYNVKGIPDEEALIVCCNGNFHGRTFGAISMSPSPESKDGFRPLLPGIVRIDYNDLDALEETFDRLGKNVAGFIAEPIQGEAGIFVPDEGYFAGVRELCDEHNVLFIADEIQTGLGRTGKMLAIEYDEVRPDVLLLGKALSGGCYPVSAVLCDTEVMAGFTVGTHGSTFGGNPIACAVAMEALQVLQEEGLAENAYDRGVEFRAAMDELMHEDGIITDVRGRGLLNAIQLDHGHPKMKEKDLDAYAVCGLLKHKGLLAKQTHGNIIRFAPPLVMTPDQLQDCIDIISETILEVES